ncbi:MAG: adenosine deaminase [Pseudomonadota bacterium]
MLDLAQRPKAELHLHLEGALEPELMFALAKRNDVQLPYADENAIRAAYDFSQLQDFLDLYYAGTSVLQSADDFHALAMHYAERAIADGVTHAECFFDPQAHTDRGIAMDVVFSGLTRAAGEARERGLTLSLILCFLRHLSEDEALRTLDAALPFRDHFIGVGLDSSEVGHPPSKFRRVFEQAGKLGLRRVAHAGEEGPPEYVWQALDELGVERIDHGNRALEDKALVARLRRDRIPLTVCPLSNLRLCVVDSLDAHPLRNMLEAGLTVTVNSDDPAYFGGYVNDNYIAVQDALGLSDRDITTLIEFSMASRFVTDT